MDKHKHIPLKSVKGSWTYTGKGTPDTKLIEAIEELAKIAYENADKLISQK